MRAVRDWWIHADFDYKKMNNQKWGSLAVWATLSD